MKLAALNLLIHYNFIHNDVDLISRDMRGRRSVSLFWKLTQKMLVGFEAFDVNKVNFRQRARSWYMANNSKGLVFVQRQPKMEFATLIYHMYLGSVA